MTEIEEAETRGAIRALDLMEKHLALQAAQSAAKRKNFAARVLRDVVRRVRLIRKDVLGGSSDGEGP